MGMDEKASRLQRQSSSAVSAGRVIPDPLWNRRCRAYNVQVRLSGKCRSELDAVQDQLEVIESGLLRCPAESLHVSVAFLLGVREDYGQHKDELWARYEGEWAGELRRIAMEVPVFKVAYRHVVATDAAVIALAEDTAEIEELRSAIYSRLLLPCQSRRKPDITHTTLFRYDHGLHHPRTLLSAVSGLSLNIVTDVQDIVISRELVYPSLEVEDLYRLPLRSEVPGGRT